MNKILLLLLLILFSSLQANSQTKICFEYDTAGNQIIRTLCINSPTGKRAKDSSKVQEEDLEKFFPEDVISYYPNPVKEELFLRWELANDNKVLRIDMYSMTGQLLLSYKNTDNLESQIIPFQQYPTGIYSVVLLYTNGDQKSIKIIKK